MMHFLGQVYNPQIILTHPKDSFLFCDIPELVKIKNELSSREYICNKASLERRVLDVAVKEGKVALVAKILERIPLQDLKGTNNGLSVLFTACFYNQYEITKMLLEKGFPLTEEKNDLSLNDESFFCSHILPNLEGLPDVLKMRDATPIYAAIFKRNLDLVKLLIDHGHPINIKTDSDNTPLLAALEYGYDDIAYFFIEKEADFDGFHVYQAIAGGCLNSLKAMIAKGGSLEDVLGVVAKVPRASEKHVNILKYLLTTSAREQINSTPDSWDHLSHVTAAALWGNLEIVKILIEAGAVYDKESILASLVAHKEGKLQDKTWHSQILENACPYRGKDLYEIREYEEHFKSHKLNIQFIDEDLLVLDKVIAFFKK